MGKGSTRRPCSVPPREQAVRWDYAFRPQGEAHLSWEEWLKEKGIEYGKVDEGRPKDEVGNSVE